MIQTMRAIITLVATIFCVSGYVEAEDWAIRDIYGDMHPVLIVPTKPIDLRFNKESPVLDYLERKKTLKEDFHEFVKENLYTYTMLWSIRVVYDPQNVQAVFSPSSLPKWLNNI